MSRSRQRICLQQGLKLDINRLIRQGLISPGTATDPHAFSWIDGKTVIARGAISAEWRGDVEGSLRIRVGELDQTITLVTLPRHLGGYQWFFVCPLVGGRALILWLPPGAPKFASRHAWPGQVAYRSQFMTPTDRAHHGQQKIKMRLIGTQDPRAWALPPKPKWMRWRTYNRHVAKFDRYEAAIDDHALTRAIKTLRSGNRSKGGGT